MGLFDFLFGKKEEAESEAESSCILGVINVIGVDDNATDLIIEGFVQGTLKVGDELVVTKISCLSKTPVKTVTTTAVWRGRSPKIESRRLPMRVPSRSPMKAMTPPTTASTRMSVIPYIVPSP